MAGAPKKPGEAYEVGYGKPPRAHQFKPGQSGNPRGRPKGQPSLADVFLREAGRLIGIKTADGVVHVSKRDAIVRKLLHQALEGDIAALRLVLPWLCGPAPADGDVDETPDAMPATDAQTIQRMLARFAHLRGEEG